LMLIIYFNSLKRKMIDLAPGDLSEIKRILKEFVPECEASIFGSRIQGRAVKFSDVDILLKGKKKLDWRRIEQLKDSFSESNLPMQVDVVDWHSASKEFRDILSGKYEVIQQPAIDGSI